jgi:hypothetical protein
VSTRIINAQAARCSRWRTGWSRPPYQRPARRAALRCRKEINARRPYPTANPKTNPIRSATATAIWRSDVITPQHSIETLGCRTRRRRAGKNRIMILGRDASAISKAKPIRGVELLIVQGCSDRHVIRSGYVHLHLSSNERNRARSIAEPAPPAAPVSGDRIRSPGAFPTPALCSLHDGQHRDSARQLMQVAFTLYMIVLFSGGPPVVTNAGTWQNASDCRNAADAAFVPKNTQGEQLPSISFMCVPRSGFGVRRMPIPP